MQPVKLSTSAINKKKRRLEIVAYISKECHSYQSAKSLEQLAYKLSGGDQSGYERLLKRVITTMKKKPTIYKDVDPIHLIFISESTSSDTHMSCASKVLLFEAPIYGVGCEGMEQCRKCKSRNVDMENRQIRSADEGMTTFCHCRDCGSRWITS